MKWMLLMVVMGFSGWSAARAQSLPAAPDTIFLVTGEKTTGTLSGIDDQSIRLKKMLSLSGTPAASGPVCAIVAILRKDIDRIEFGPDESRQRMLAEAAPDNLPQVETHWMQNLPWLAVARSPAGAIGLAYGNLLLRSGDSVSAAKACAVFSVIEENSWSNGDAAAAKQGRLRAMVAGGRAAEAVSEALELARLSEEPAVLIEARHILAKAAEKNLRQLVEENPRWQEDVNVIPERARLYNEALDGYLFPSLFFGSESDSSARGLWGAVEVYRLSNETRNALETARDLVTLYPGTRCAREAAGFIAALPEEIRNHDNEKEAKDDESVPPESPND